MRDEIISGYWGDERDPFLPLDPEGCSIEEWSYYYGRPPLASEEPACDEADIPF